MDREEFIKILSEYESRKGYITIEKAHNLLINYCMDKGKTQDEAITLVHKVLATPFIQANCLKVALKCYSDKFTIARVLSTPLENGQRNTLLIF
jgi:hypothetical protein